LLALPVKVLGPAPMLNSYMKSKLFDHFIARAILAVMLVWSFLTIFLIVGFGAGEVFKLIIIRARPYWWAPQTLAWIGLFMELAALILVRSPYWRKLAYAGTFCLVFSAIFFLLRADDFRFLSLPKVSLPICIFVASCILRVMQLRRKPSAPANLGLT
jgi:hypothetical protein